MGEYGTRISDGQQIKFGTCETMYYLRVEDGERVESDGHSVNPATDDGLFFRLPYPDEDGILPGDYEPYKRGYRLGRMAESGRYQSDGSPITIWKDFEDNTTTDSPGIIQLTHSSGLLVNLPCYHGVKLPNAPNDGSIFWNGKSHSLELTYVKRHKGALRPVVACRWCGHMWSYEWEEILPYAELDPIMEERLRRYAEQSAGLLTV